MINWCYVDTDNFVTVSGDAADSSEIPQLPGGRVVPVETGLVPGRSYRSGASFATLPEPPSPAHTIDRANKRWVLNPALAAAQARKQRDHLIAKSDWTQLPDIDQTVKDKWQPYRQALRDITSQPGFPENIQWPEPPK